MVGHALKSLILSSWQSAKIIEHFTSSTMPYHWLQFVIGSVLFVLDTNGPQPHPSRKKPSLCKLLRCKR